MWHRGLSQPQDWISGDNQVCSFSHSLALQGGWNGYRNRTVSQRRCRSRQGEFFKITLLTRFCVSLDHSFEPWSYTWGMPCLWNMHVYSSWPSRSRRLCAITIGSLETPIQYRNQCCFNADMFLHIFGHMDSAIFRGDKEANHNKIHNFFHTGIQYLSF